MVLEIHLQDQQMEVNQVDQVVVEVKQILQLIKHILEQVILLQLVHHKVFQVEQVI